MRPRDQLLLYQDQHTETLSFIRAMGIDWLVQLVHYQVLKTLMANMIVQAHT